MSRLPHPLVDVPGQRLGGATSASATPPPEFTAVSQDQGIDELMSLTVVGMNVVHEIE
jgi:hypothetical protein